MQSYQWGSNETTIGHFLSPQVFLALILGSLSNITTLPCHPDIAAVFARWALLTFGFTFVGHRPLDDSRLGREDESVLLKELMGWELVEVVVERASRPRDPECPCHGERTVFVGEYRPGRRSAEKEIGRVAGRAREQFAKFHPGGFNILAQTDLHAGFVCVPREWPQMQV